jgi:hypothetical protein
MTATHRAGCLVCGRDLEYLDAPEEMTCSLCGERAVADVRCVAGHYVCDRCHAAGANDLIERVCIATDIADPLAIACLLMDHPAVKMHGPEHHFLVPAALLAAYCNLTGRQDEKEAWIKKARARAETVPGGACGMMGACGAAIGTGIFIAIVTGSTPLAGRAWQLSNEMTARALSVIARYGGPRCCKRDSWLAIREAVGFCREKLGITLPFDEEHVCTFSAVNRECRREACLFYGGEE